jgi:ABC-type branched-subunit amino acid transport system substrate-binding protein
MTRSPFKIVAGLAAVGLLAAACSSSGSSSSSTTVKTSGAPIVVGQINPTTGANLSLPEQASSLAASVAALNQAGGIKGHSVKLIQCDSQDESSLEVQCAQEMVSDHVVATLGDDIFANPTSVQAILTNAGIPGIGGPAASPAQYQAKNNFDFTGGGVFDLVGEMDALVAKGDKKISVLLPDQSVSTETHLLLDPIAASLGAEVVNYVLVSSTSGDYSQYIAQAEENGAQGILFGLGEAQTVEVAQVLNQLNPKLDVAAGMAFSLNQLKDLGQFAKKTLWVWWEPGIDDVKNFPGLAQPIAQLTANTKGASANTMTTISIQQWLTVHAFAEVMKTQTGTLTAASVMAAFQSAKSIPMNGIIKPWTPTDYQNAGTFNSIFSNVSNPWMYKITFNGTNTETNPSTLFNTFAGLPGT